MSFKETAWRASKALHSLDRFSSPAARRAPAPLRAARLNPWPAPDLVRAAPASADDLIAAADRVAQAKWIFRTVDRHPVRREPLDRDPVSGLTAPMSYGPTIDIATLSWSAARRNVWEINRHFQLVTLGQAWAATGRASYRDAASDDDRLLADRMPLSAGINWISALEHGIRLINWYMGSRLLGCSKTPTLRRKALARFHLLALPLHRSASIPLLVRQQSLDR